MSKEEVDRLLPLRRQARDLQTEVLQRRLERHRELARQLLADPARAFHLIADAQAMVVRWRAERLCSDDYSDAWSAILANGYEEIAAAIVSQNSEWDMLRQCSPFVGTLVGD